MQINAEPSEATPDAGVALRGENPGQTLPDRAVSAPLREYFNPIIFI